MMQRPFGIEIEVPAQPYCPKHSLRMAPYGTTFLTHLCGHAVHMLYAARRLSLMATPPELTDALQAVTPLCCFVGDDRLAMIESALVTDASYNGPSD